MKNIGIYVGTLPETVKEIKSSILELLNAHADQETIRVALGILSLSAAAPQHTSISDCHIDMGQPAAILSDTVDGEEEDEY